MQLCVEFQGLHWESSSIDIHLTLYIRVYQLIPDLTDRTILARQLALGHRYYKRATPRSLGLWPSVLTFACFTQWTFSSALSWFFYVVGKWWYHNTFWLSSKFLPFGGEKALIFICINEYMIGDSDGHTQLPLQLEFSSEESKQKGHVSSLRISPQI